VHNDLLPAFGRIKLCDLRARHVEAWVAGQLAAGRGRVAVSRAGATLRIALNAAVRERQLAYNPALHAILPRPGAAERLCWSYEQAAAFLRHNKECYADQLADLYEVMIGTGMRRGEVLGLHWADVHLMERSLFVRWSLAAVDNNRLHLGPPKTKASRSWVGLSPRVMAAFHRQVQARRNLQPLGAPLQGLVFAHPDGSPLRPQRVLDQLRRRTKEIGLPRIGLHDLRHTAATIMISEGQPIALVSKTLRHSTLATTLNTYGHLMKYAAHDTVAALSGALDRADADHIPGRPATALRFAA
jgi:integrase